MNTIPDNELPKRDLIDTIKDGRAQATIYEKHSPDRPVWIVRNGWLEYSGDHSIGHTLIRLDAINSVTVTTTGIDIYMGGDDVVTLDLQADGDKLIAAIQWDGGRSWIGEVSDDQA